MAMRRGEHYPTRPQHLRRPPGHDQSSLALPAQVDDAVWTAFDTPAGTAPAITVSGGAAPASRELRNSFFVVATEVCHT